MTTATHLPGAGTMAYWSGFSGSRSAGECRPHLLSREKGEEAEEWGERKDNEKRANWGGDGGEQEQPAQGCGGKWLREGVAGGVECGFMLAPGAQMASPILEALAGISVLRGWCHKWDEAMYHYSVASVSGPLCTRHSAKHRAPLLCQLP